MPGWRTTSNSTIKLRTMLSVHVPHSKVVDSVTYCAYWYKVSISFTTVISEIGNKEKSKLFVPYLMSPQWYEFAYKVYLIVCHCLIELLSLHYVCQLHTTESKVLLCIVGGAALLSYHLGDHFQSHTQVDLCFGFLFQYSKILEGGNVLRVISKDDALPPPTLKLLPHVHSLCAAKCWKNLKYPLAI